MTADHHLHAYYSSLFFSLFLSICEINLFKGILCYLPNHIFRPLLIADAKWKAELMALYIILKTLF